MRQTQTYRAGRVFLAGIPPTSTAPPADKYEHGHPGRLQPRVEPGAGAARLSPDTLLDSHTPERHDLGKSILRMT